MSWNWELPEWPTFTYETTQVIEFEKQFFMQVGSASAYLKVIERKDYKRFIVEILCLEGLGSSKIEGEVLDRASLQSSIRHHFGLDIKAPSKNKESGMAELLCDVYDTYDQPLTHEMLWSWHAMLFGGEGKYRTHEEPMQIVSHRYDVKTVYFEAPPSNRIFQEMDAFITWFNQPSDLTLVKAAIAHVYFESIHPFEDGNGRIGRALVEKILSQGVKRPVLIAVSKMLENRKKAYYAALEKCNRTLSVNDWVQFFSHVILDSQKEAMKLLYFIIEKSKMLQSLEGEINERQEKALLRMFEEGPDGFVGGLSAEKYMAITKTTRPTATRDLTDLVEKGALLKKGELKYTRYNLNFRLRYEHG